MPYGVSRFVVQVTENILTKAQEKRAFEAIPTKKTFTTYSWYEEDLSVGDIGFVPGSCPPTLTENNATRRSVTLRNIGISVQVSELAIKESAALQSITMEYPTTTGALIEQTAKTELEAAIGNATAFLIAGVDRLLVNGNSSADNKVFDGIETLVTQTNGAAFRDASASPFDFNDFSSFVQSIGGGVTHLFGHPLALAQVYRAAMSAGGATPMFIINDGTVPGLGFGSKIATLGGVLTLVPDMYFTVTPGTNDFVTDLFVLNLNGDVFRAEFEPITYVPEPANSCLVVKGLLYTVTALVVKNMFRQGRYRAKFQGSPAMSLPLM